MKIGIVGLGTIGGSFAKAIKTYSDHTVFGMDKNEDAVAFAKFSDAIDGVLTEETLGECDLLLLALYPMASAEFLEANGRFLSKDAVAVDLCGVKRAVFDRMKAAAAKYGFTFIGGHPHGGCCNPGIPLRKRKNVQGRQHDPGPRRLRRPPQVRPSLQLVPSGGVRKDRYLHTRGA